MAMILVPAVATVHAAEVVGVGVNEVIPAETEIAVKIAVIPVVGLLVVIATPAAILAVQ